MDTDDGRPTMTPAQAATGTPVGPVLGRAGGPVHHPVTRPSRSGAPSTPHHWGVPPLLVVPGMVILGSVVAVPVPTLAAVPGLGSEGAPLGAGGPAAHRWTGVVRASIVSRV